jgi:hypothetical protein
LKNKTHLNFKEDVGGISELPEEIHDTDEISSFIKRAPNKESFCLMNPSTINAPELQLIDIHNPRLQHIYNDEREELEKNF